jgi:hypothetical protein
MAEYNFAIDPGVVNQYKNINYTAWHALAELVDNSTQSFFDNEDLLRADADRRNDGEDLRPLKVSITYERDGGPDGKGILRVVDNAMGMTAEDLQGAMVVGRKPDTNAGRSQYGMGLKTAGFWCGENLSIRTTCLGSSTEYQVDLDVAQIGSGNLALDFNETAVDPGDHHTIIEITHLNHRWVGQTMGKIERYLRSMYRVDTRDDVLLLEWQGNSLEWSVGDDGEFAIKKAQNGKPWRKDFDLELPSGRRVTGWAAILSKGSRGKAGFTILRQGRAITGWPDSWRPPSIFGDQVGGTNTLVNQRLFGEISADEFDVSQTKDFIQWQGSEEEDVEKMLREECSDLIAIAKRPKKEKGEEGGPSDAIVQEAVGQLTDEVGTSPMADAFTFEPGAEASEAKEVFDALKRTVDDTTPNIEFDLADLRVSVWLSGDSSFNDPYVAVDSEQSNVVMVIVNTAHPHWQGLETEDSVLNYLRECTYDSIAEWKARRRSSTIEPDTIKLYKDRYLRVKFEIDNQGPLST